MAFAVTIDFPHGYYQGRDASGEPELFPTPTRLYSALVSAAFEADIPEPSLGRLLAALAWLEGNPPDAVTLPEARMSWAESATAYRKTGLARPGKGKTIDTGYAASGLASRVSSVDGPVVYWWEKNPTEAESQILASLSDEVAYIGERPSLARVQASRVDEIGDGALPISKNFLLPDSQAVRLDYPEVGRLKELSDAHASRRPDKSPTIAQDRPKTKEDEVLAPVPRICVGAARYLLPRQEMGSTPWTRGLLVPVLTRRSTAGIEPSEYVAWSVALHRAIVKRIGWGAPPIVTGKYAQGMPQPANHMAIQLLPAQANPAFEPSFDGPAFAVLFPPEATAQEIGAVRGALRATHSLYRGRAGQLRLGRAIDFDPTRYWGSPPEGHEYWWQPQPGAVVEIRGDQEGPSGKPWSVADALKLAVGFVFRQEFGDPELRGLSLYQQVVRNVSDAGVRVECAHKLHPRRKKDFVHRHQVPGALTVVSGQLFMKPLGIDRQLVAVGQSRHLGGGLLVPVAVPKGQLPATLEGEF